MTVNIEELTKLQGLIEDVLPIVQSKAKSAAVNERGMYQGIAKNLQKMLDCLEGDEFSLVLKKELNCGPVLATLYHGATSLPELGNKLCDINNKFQALDIDVTDDNGARDFLRIISK